MANIANNKKFPDHYYFVYDLDKSELGKYHNTWFKGERDSTRLDKVTNNNIVLYDSLWTVKTVDKETESRLYYKKYNPVSVRIMAPTGAKFKCDKFNNRLYTMKAEIHSIDDSSFGVWWNDEGHHTLDKLKGKRSRILDYLTMQKKVNGEKFLQFCIEEVGADPDSVDYN